jgi:hypothetical protein
MLYFPQFSVRKQAFAKEKKEIEETIQVKVAERGIYIFYCNFTHL